MQTKSYHLKKENLSKISDEELDLVLRAWRFERAVILKDYSKVGAILTSIRLEIEKRKIEG
jgi:hypothetical protein